MDSKLYNDIGKAVEIAKKNGGTLTEQNLLYVVKVATDIANKTGADFDSLLAEGVIAMMKMEEKYDPAKNDKFVKSAAMAVRGYMLNSINRQGNLVHIPANHMKGFKKGQDRLDASKIEYCPIDATNYDTLGEVDNTAFEPVPVTRTYARPVSSSIRDAEETASTSGSKLELPVLEK